MNIEEDFQLKIQKVTLNSIKIINEIQNIFMKYEIGESTYAILCLIATIAYKMDDEKLFKSDQNMTVKDLFIEHINKTYDKICEMENKKK
jgi:hypothetical protein